MDTKTLYPTLILLLGQFFSFLGTKGKAEPEHSYGLGYRGLAPSVRYPAETVCAALAIGLS